MVLAPVANTVATNGLWRLPQGWEWARIDAICSVNPYRPRLHRSEQAPTSFLPMSGVDEVHGIINSLETKPFAKVVRGFTYFQEGDVLFAKITPSMENGKCAIAQSLIDDIGFGSTEFHVLRPGPCVIPKWVHLYVRRLSFRLEAKRHFRGAVGQQRVPDDFLKSFPIPVPTSLCIQRHIVARIEALLAEIKRARTLLDHMRRDASRLMDATLEGLIGELKQANVDCKPLGSLLLSKPQYGLSRKASEDSQGIPILRMGNIVNGRISLDDLKYISLEPREEKKYLLQYGDILFNRTNSAELVGKSAVFEISDPAVFASYLIRIVPNPDKAKSHYLVAYINSRHGRNYIQSQLTRAIGQVNVNAKKLAVMPILIPDIKRQEQIVSYISSVQNQVNEMYQLLAQNSKIIGQLEQSILERAFRGEL